MAKIFGAGIRCATCDAQPFPDNSTTTRETFDLLKIGGVWCCELHRPPKERAPRETVDAHIVSPETLEASP